MTGGQAIQEDTPSWTRSRPLALLAVLLAPFMALLDIFIVNVAAPSIEKQLHTNFGAVQLVIGGYIVAFAMGLVTGGRLGDMLGRRRIYMTGVAAFAVTSAGCAIAPSVGVLIAMRVLQGLSGALVLPQVLALIQVLFPDEQARVLGYFGAAQSAGSISGQILGGALIQVDWAHLGWRTIFLVNVPFCLVTLACSLAGIPPGRGRGTGVRFDPLGVVLLSTAVALLLAPLVFGPQEGWPAATWPTLAGALLMFAIFVWWESRLSMIEGAALLPMRLFRLPGFANGLPTAAAFYCGNAGFYLILAFYLQDGIRLSPLGAAAEFVPIGAVFALVSLLSGRLLARFGNQVPSWGAATIILGLIVLSLGVGNGSHLSQALHLLPGLVICGIGQGLVVPALLGIVLRRVNTADVGAASGGLLTASQVAQALGIAGVGAIFGSVLAGHDYRTAFVVSVLALGALGLVSLLLLVRLTGRTKEPRPA